MVDQARKWRIQTGALSIKKKKKFTRNRMNLDLARHFLEYMFASNLIQDIAYGTSTISFSNGQRQVSTNYF